MGACIEGQLVPTCEERGSGGSMSPIAAVREIWRQAMPPTLRRMAAPTLNRAMAHYVRASARAPHGAHTAHGPIKVVGYFGGSHGIAASARLAVRAFDALGVPVERIDVTDAKLDWSGRLTEPVSAGAWIFHLN